MYVVIGMILVVAELGYGRTRLGDQAWLESHSHDRIIATICTVSIGVAFQHPNCSAFPSSVVFGLPVRTHKALSGMHL